MPLASRRSIPNGTWNHRLPFRRKRLIYPTSPSLGVEASDLKPYYYPFGYTYRQSAKADSVGLLNTKCTGERRMLRGCCRGRVVRWPTFQLCHISVQNTFKELILICDLTNYSPLTLTSFLSLIRVHGRLVRNSNVLVEEANIRFLDLKIRANFSLDYHFTIMCIRELYGIY